MSHLKMKDLALITLLALTCSAAHATSGAVDANGCHNSKKLGFHCHPERASTMTRADAKKANDEDKRLKRECKGRPNAGACLGYAS